MSGSNWQRARGRRVQRRKTAPNADVRAIRIERRLFENMARATVEKDSGKAAALVATIDWGERDEQGFYTPSISWTTPVSRRTWWQRLLGLDT